MDVVNRPEWCTRIRGARQLLVLIRFQINIHCLLLVAQVVMQCLVSQGALDLFRDTTLHLACVEILCLPIPCSVDVWPQAAHEAPVPPHADHRDERVWQYVVYFVMRTLQQRWHSAAWSAGAVANGVPEDVEASVPQLTASSVQQWGAALWRVWRPLLASDHPVMSAMHEWTDFHS